MKNTLFILCIVFILMNCKAKENELLKELNSVANQIDSIEHSNKIVKLDSLTKFKWDSVYVFNEHEEDSYISSIIGFEWKGPDVPNINIRLLFVDRYQVVSYTDYSLSELPIYFYNCRSRYVFAREEATFVTFAYCGTLGRTYPFIPINCMETTERFKDMQEKKCE